jgi:menaquinone-9 beta-reductase
LSPDVVVIGGGPGGLGAAVRLARGGADVLVCERRRDPGDKPCGEGLLPRAVGELEGLGLNRAELGAAGYQLRGVRYISARGVRAEAAFPEGTGLGLSRAGLQRLLKEVAERTRGLSRHEGEARLLVDSDGTCRVRLDDRVVTPRLVVGADGLASKTRAAAQLTATRPAPLRYGIRQHFAIPPWSAHVEVYFSDHAEAYVTPISADEVNVAFLWRPDRAHALAGGSRLIPRLLQHFPLLSHRLAGRSCTTDARAAGPLWLRVPRTARNGLLLLGDAAGYIDAITGEGVGLALAKARLLARLWPNIASGRGSQVCEAELGPYLRAARDLERPHVMLTRSLLALRRVPALTERVIEALGRDPELFATFLSINQGRQPLSSLPLASSLKLAQRVAFSPRLGPDH